MHVVLSLPCLAPCHRRIILNDHEMNSNSPRLNRIPHIEYCAVFEIGSVKQLLLLSDVVVIEGGLDVQYTLHKWKYCWELLL